MNEANRVLGLLGAMTGTWALPGWWNIRRASPKPTGGHRRRGYKRTDADLRRLEAAKERRAHRGARMQRDYDKCLAGNPCRAAA